MSTQAMDDSTTPPLRPVEPEAQLGEPDERDLERGLLALPVPKLATGADLVAALDLARKALLGAEAALEGAQGHGGSLAVLHDVGEVVGAVAEALATGRPPRLESVDGPAERLGYLTDTLAHATASEVHTVGQGLHELAEAARREVVSWRGHPKGKGSGPGGSEEPRELTADVRLLPERRLGPDEALAFLEREGVRLLSLVAETATAESEADREAAAALACDLELVVEAAAKAIRDGKALHLAPHDGGHTATRTALVRLLAWVARSGDPMLHPAADLLGERLAGALDEEAFTDPHTIWQALRTYLGPEAPEFPGGRLADAEWRQVAELAARLGNRPHGGLEERADAAEARRWGDFWHRLLADPRTPELLALVEEIGPERAADALRRKLNEREGRA